MFQFTLPCGERRQVFCNALRMDLFQFTLPCGERQRCICRFFNTDIVSIHAPVRGATFLDLIYRVSRSFQFTLPCGERRMSQFQDHSNRRCFNSRSRAGSDDIIGFRFSRMIVSIHAPVRGATAIRLINGAFFILFRKNFQY